MNAILFLADTMPAGAPGATGGHWSEALLSFTLTLGVVAVAFGMLCCVWRLLRGPHLADRALAVDTFAVLLIGLVILFAIQFQTLWFADGILVLSLLSFAGTVAMAQFIGRPHLRRQTRQEVRP